MFYFRDVRTSEMKLQLNNAASGRLKRNKILFYFRRPHIREIKHWNKTHWNSLKQF